MTPCQKYKSRTGCPRLTRPRDYGDVLMVIVLVLAIAAVSLGVLSML